MYLSFSVILHFCLFYLFVYLFRTVKWNELFRFLHILFIAPSYLQLYTILLYGYKNDIQIREFFSQLLIWDSDGRNYYPDYLLII